MNAPATIDGYVADATYPAHFHRETLPVWLAAACTALGRRAPDLAQPYTWLDLGCGSGVGVVVAAATNPLGQFIGIDANPGAVADAQALASAAGVRNVQFHCLRFDQALQPGAPALPACDFIVSHGVYAWISRANRAALRALVQRQLKPGGVLYLGYMSQPGAAAMSAAQKLAHLATRGLPGNLADKASASAELLERVAQAGSGYFEEHPRLQGELRRLASLDPHYLAHELLNSDAEALHVADVMAELAEDADCEFAGSATLIENLDAASLPAACQPLLGELQRRGADAALQETFKDITRNQNLRRDLYQRRQPSGNLLTPEAHRQQLLAQRVCLLPAAPTAPVSAQGELALDTRIGPVRVPMAHLQPLLAALQAGPQRYADLARLPAYAAQPGFINQLLQVLIWAGWVHPLRPDLPTSGQADNGADLAALQAALAQRPVGQPPIRLHALAAMGSAIGSPMAIGSGADDQKKQPAALVQTEPPTDWT